MATPLRRGMSAVVGWLADRRVPGPLRKPVYRGYARLTGADPSEAQLPLTGYTSLGSFFVRRLRAGARTIDPDPDAFVSPCDGRLQACGRIENGSLLQAKGQTYEVGELLAGASDPDALADATTWTIYLGPRDYHRVHCPLEAVLSEVRWIPGNRHSVAPKVLAARARVLSTNERAVLTLDSDRGRYYLVMVGALNVGRIRVVGVEPGAPRPSQPDRVYARGAELARFEMGSTVVLVLPAGMVRPLEALELGQGLSLGQAIGRFGAVSAPLP